jgi:hypothetical protein
MKQSRMLFKMVGLSVITAGLLVGCGGNGSTATNISSEKLSGSLVKGPITAATITVYDADGKEVATTTSLDGKFVLPNISSLDSDYYTIESTGGSYEDEATTQTVNIGANEGLKTLVTKAEFQDMLTKSEFVALTPETTIFAELTKEKLQDRNLSTAISESEQLIYDFLIKDTSPVMGLSGDVLTKRGDLTKAIPSDQSQAFAKNRAISFSNLMENLGIEPGRVFEVLGKLKEDFVDG